MFKLNTPIFSFQHFSENKAFGSKFAVNEEIKYDREYADQWHNFHRIVATEIKK